MERHGASHKITASREAQVEPAQPASRPMKSIVHGVEVTSYTADDPYWAEEAARTTPEQKKESIERNTPGNYRPWGRST